MVKQHAITLMAQASRTTRYPLSMRTPFLLPSVILQRMLIALCMCAAGTLVSRATAQDNAAPLWRAAFQAAGYGTPAPIISTDEEAFLGNLQTSLWLER